MSLSPVSLLSAYINPLCRQIQLGTAPCEYVVISWGGAFFTCGRVKQRDSRITVGKVHCRSDLGGEQLVATMMVIVLRKGSLRRRETTDRRGKESGGKRAEEGEL